jgi:hypothetical protein
MIEHTETTGEQHDVYRHNQQHAAFQVEYKKKFLEREAKPEGRPRSSRQFWRQQRPRPKTLSRQLG